MGASDSKLVFKKGIFRLSEERNIRADDPYWTSFWELPESTEDVFSLFSPADIRRTRDTALENLETLILAITSRLFILRHHPSFPDLELAPERDALNCVRILTRLLPYLYEKDNLQQWEDKFFWASRRKRTRKAAIQSEVLFDDHEQHQPRNVEEQFEDAKPLAEELIDTLIDMMFFADFTLPRSATAKSKVTYAIWQSGVGCNNAAGTTKEYENNRAEILRLLLTLTSKSMYLTANILPVLGVKAITYIATCPDKQVVLSVLCSLLNTTLKYNPASWRVPYNHVVFKDPKQILVAYCLQFLLVILLYPIPEGGHAGTQKNYYRHFLGRLHRPQDFQFINDGMLRILNQPVSANTSYLPGSHVSMKFSSEMIMLFWEITQCNKRFRSFIIDTERSHDFVVLILFYALEHKLDSSKQGVVRMCVFLLQTLSVEPNFGASLNKRFENQETLPACIRIPNFEGTHADHLIHNIYSLITTCQGKLAAVYPALLAVINNIAAYLQNLSTSTSTKLLQLCASMSSPAFLLANDSNHELLQSLLNSISSIIEHQYSRNAAFIYSVLRNRKRFEALRNFTLESGQAEIEHRQRRRKEDTSVSTDNLLDNVLMHGPGDSIRSPISSHRPSLSNVPEEGTDEAFAIGDDDEEQSDADESSSDNAMTQTPTHSTLSDPPSRPTSRPTSVSSTIEDAVPVQLRGMSEKARGKMPASVPSFSRQSSISSLTSYAGAGVAADGIFCPTSEWIESWLPHLPLHTILTLIQELSSLDLNTTSPELTSHIADQICTAEISGIESSAIRIHSFEWSPLSLGWYESLLWSFIFTSEMQVSKGTVGTWNGTHIKLFRVQETAAESPSLSSPRGAVDAVGSNIINRIGALNLRASIPGTSIATGRENESDSETRPNGNGTSAVV